MPLNFRQIAIIGVGHIGASIGLALKRRGFSGRIIGFGRTQSNLDDALRLGCIDDGETSRHEGLKNADLIVLCVPVRSMPEWFNRLKDKLRKDAILTDAGSVKNSIVNAARAAGVISNFVPAHPIAGTEKTGAKSADGNIFEGRLCILTPGKQTSINVLKRGKEFWRFLGCRLIEMNPRDHDRVLAFVSHLPHAVAFSLVNAVLRGDEDADMLAGGGFRDWTRIASSSPEMWRDIFLDNKKSVLRAIRLFQNELRKLYLAIKDENEEGIFDLLLNARNLRNQSVVNKNG